MNKSPFGILFGIALRMLRESSGRLSSDEVAQRVGISPSHYRLLEAGSANLQPSRIAAFVRCFDQLDFAALAAFVAAAEFFDAASARQRGRSEHILDEMQQLYPPLEPLCSAIASRLEARLQEKEFRGQAMTSGLVERLLEFLRGVPATPSTLRSIEPRFSHVLDLCGAVSPFVLEAFERSLEQFVGMTLRFTPAELYMFEDNNWRRFTRVTAVVRSTELVLETTAVKADARTIQGYRYLWSSLFSELRVIYSAHTNPSSHKELFFRRLRTDLESQPAAHHFELSNFDKIRNRVIFEQACSEEVLDAILTYREQRMQHFWLYDIGAVSVGFIDAAQPKARPTVDRTALSRTTSQEAWLPTGDILSLQDTLQRQSLLNQLRTDVP